MRKLVVGDIHSGVRALEQVLERAKVTPADHVIFLGDYADGWSTAVETIDFLIDFKESHNCTFLRGNHDELCKDWLVGGEHNEKWLAHGGAVTRQSYENDSREYWDTHLDFYNSLKNYFLDSDTKLYLHAGYTNLHGVEHEYFEKLFYWDRTLWELAQAMNPALKPGMPGFPQRLSHYEEIFIGHTPISKVKVVPPKNSANVWNIDTGAAFQGALTIMDVDTKQYWQSEPVNTFYPGELGRN